MPLPTSRQCLWHAKHFLGAIGWPGIAAAFLFMLCGTFAYFVLAPMQSRIAVTRQQTIALRNQAKIKLPSIKKERDPAEQLAAFHAFFPKQATLPDAMAKLYDAAAQQSLILDQGDYRFTHDQDSKLIRYEIALPVKGGYVQLRKFLAQAMTDLPNLSLDSISFSRQKIGDTMVDAQLQFSLYFDQT